ncbi:mannitol dehydrogenase family protein [Pikeienuella piscinae]|uniref:mannitol dehydrogenase family protein n=1 Tax=Pikeienuella piscinae TaxID=2748098 RepID=UPI001FEBF8EE|nr:mannitol dehydrogenase family protein [Pikeienuella piscinae]
MNPSAPRLARSAAARPGAGIVHLGLGAFFRAHGAFYIAEAIAKSGGDWGVVGLSLMNPAMRDRLAPQDFAYTAVDLGPEGEIPRVVEVVRDVLVARENPEAALAAMADPAIRIVSLTVTEKGYCHEPATGRLNPDHPDIVHDLANPAAPRSAPGYLVRALARRREAGLRPFTVLTCDNLPQNGRVVRSVVLDLAAAVDPALADWIAAEGRFPATMVDRIVPATSAADIARVTELTGFADAAPVVHEPFRQWVIEDDFVDGARPDLAAAGARMVKDVAAFEHMKLRMLNGAHSALSYLGYLGGHETIAETVADPVYARFVKRLWRDEIIPALTPPPGEDLHAYADALFSRFANPAIRHRTWQIAMDGSQKLPQRILGTIAENRVAGRPCPGLHLAVAAWMRYVGGVDEKDDPIDVRDPLAERLRALSDAAPDGPAKVAALLGLRQIFTPEQAAAMRDDVSAAYATLTRLGARAAIEGAA